MAPFLDQSLDLTNQAQGSNHPHNHTGALSNLKGITQKHMSGAGGDRNSGQDLSDAIRPKTSTGLRGSGIYSKMNTIGGTDDHHGPQGAQGNTTTKVLNGDKPDGIRTQLRRSYDANAVNLPHPHGIQPSSNVTKFNRPHSSSKLANQGRPTHQQ